MDIDRSDAQFHSILVYSFLMHVKRKRAFQLTEVWEVWRVALQQALRPIQIPKKGKEFSENFFNTGTVVVFQRKT